MARRKQRATGSTTFTLADLEKMVREREAEIAKLARRRESITAALDDVDAQIRSVGGVAVPTRRGPGRPKGKRGPGRPPKVKAKRGRPAKAAKARKSGKRPGRPAGPKGQSPLHDAIRAAMKDAAAPTKAVDIAKKVVDGGYETKSKVFHLIIGQRLAEMADVVKPERGLYALKA